MKKDLKALNTSFLVEQKLLFSTNKGIKRADSLLTKEFTPGNSSVRQRIKSIEKEYSTCYELKFSHGEKIIIGANANIYTKNGWKSIEEILKGDFCLFKKCFFIESNSYPIPELITKSKIKFPEENSNELSKWLGIISSRGINSNGVISITAYNQEQLDIIKNLSFKIFNIEPSVFEDNRKSRSPKVSLLSKDLSLFLKKIIGHNKIFKRIPSIIMNGTIEERLSFLEGVGLKSRIKDDLVVFFYGKSLSFLKDLKFLLKTFGYNSSIKKDNRGEKPIYSLVLRSRSDNSPIININKKIFSKIKISNDLVYINNNLMNSKLPKNDSRWRSLMSFKKNKKEDEFALCRSRIYNYLNIPYDNEYKFEKIISISKKEMDLQRINVFTKSGIIAGGLIIG